MFGGKKKIKGFLNVGLNEKINKEKEVQKNKGNKVQIKQKLVIAVTSLKHGTGTSYIAAAVANYLFERSGDGVCMIHKGCSYANSILFDEVDSIFYPCDMSNAYAKYNFIVYDGGIFQEIDKNMLDRSDIKIMMCWHNDEYEDLLQEFIGSRNDLNNWVFLFNLAKEEEEEVFDLMEDYSSYCLPEFRTINLNKQIKTIFNEMFNKR